MSGKVGVAGIGQVAIMVAQEFLDGQTRHGIPGPLPIGKAGDNAESMLRKALLPDEIAALDSFPAGILEIGDAVFEQFVIVAELFAPSSTSINNL